ncbi:MAG: GTP-binding protein Obg/CgtA [Chlamydiales bacterium]|jgi:GTP-binding protein|nr:GTP-binding protein Obg/CgtA [Chlamydiales bacterium]
MFIDRVKLKIIAGKGGNGIIAWRREKYIPKGGPCGGDGGMGGSITFEADPEVFSLEAFRHSRILKAENGQCGGPNQRKGRSGKDLLIKVPCGTLIKDENGELIIDLEQPKARYKACQGGKGGKGNVHFKSPTNQAPNICTPGTLGQECALELELKLIADIGLVGFPNAGKSTLISKLSNVRVKIAPYPFTTLRPNIGLMRLDGEERAFIADIPGIIEGAHLNRGLGLEFLRHIERTKILVYMIDSSGIDGRDPFSDYQVLRDELSAYDPALLERPSLVVLNKIDCEESLEHIQAFKEAYKGDAESLFEISAGEGTGLGALRQKLVDLYFSQRETPPIFDPELASDSPHSD